MNKYDLKNASISIPYNDFDKITEELNALRDFLKKTFWCCDTPNEIKKEAIKLNRLYDYWL